MARMSLDTELKMVLKNVVGIGTRRHVDGFSCDTTLLIISISASVKKLILLQQVEGDQKTRHLEFPDQYST